MKYYLLLLWLLLTSIYSLHAQSLPPAIIHSVDTLFAGWSNTTPGCVIGIVRNDSLVYAKGYGMANLEYNAPNTPLTLYDVGSVSKQFTAYCIVLLAEQHQLNLDDDIHKYISWLKIKDKITIRNLLNHTSGIREYFQLLAIAGKSEDDAFTQQLAIHILSQQQTLNYKPGEKYLYSNSNYLLLAEIIKKISGKTLRQFADSAIFKPLKMSSAYFSDDYNEIQKNRAYSYNKTDSTPYTKAFATDADVGAGNLFCNVEDMAKWVANFYNSAAGNAATIKILTHEGKLNNGTEISYAAGINAGDYRGWTMYEHEGESAAFSSCVSIFPELKMGFIVFANAGSTSAQRENFAIADMFLSNKQTKPVARPVAAINSEADVIENSNVIQKYTGKYLADDGALLDVVISNKRLYAVQNNDSELLIKNEKDTFFQVSSPDKKFAFSTTSSGAKVADEYWPNHSRRLYLCNTEIVFSNEQLKQYAGTYLCAELACIYTISVHNNQLMISSNIYAETPLWFDGNDDLFSNYGWMSHMQIARNKQQQITGFEVNSSRVLHLIFTKIKITGL